MFDVKVALHPEVHVFVKANVARSDDEAELQKQGIDVIGQQADEDRAEGEGFTEAIDPNAEPAELPVEVAEVEAEETPAEGEENAEGYALRERIPRWPAERSAGLFVCAFSVAEMFRTSEFGRGKRTIARS